MRLEATTLTERETALQHEVRSWLDQRLPAGSYELGLGMSGRVDPQFSRDLGRQGWVGMTLPRAYGGGGRTQVERVLVVQELLARGAPLGYHWVADRQSGPQIASHGTEEQKRGFLPGIARGELSFSIGMSEPEAGSDLASLRTTAKWTGDGWRVTGHKIWTSGAMTATHILALFRTSEDRHGGLTQFIVDRNDPGLHVAPIPFLDGTSDFCELSFDDLRLPDSRRLGEIGAGWSQNRGELALERGGPERWMSVVSLLQHWAHSPLLTEDPSARAELGALTARHWAYHGLSLSVARMVDQGHSPVIEAALIKEMGTRFEQDCVATLTRLLGRTPDLDASDPYEALLARAVLVSPSWTIRGGTNEILRTIIAKGLTRA